MAIAEFEGQRTSAPDDVRLLLGEYGIPYENWGLRGDATASDDEVLKVYAQDIERLKNERGYVTADLIALRPDTPKLDDIIAKFDREHHHSEDEVRFVVSGEGVFEINADATRRIRFTAQPGDLIVIPANRRHLFYLTEKKSIRCIRLFKTQDGWQAIYEEPFEH